MKRLIPDSVAGRTLAVLLLGLAVSHALSMLFYVSDRSSALALTGGEHLAERIVTITRMVENAPADRRGEIVALADRPSMRVTLGDNPRVGGDSEPSDRHDRLLQEGLEEHFRGHRKAADLRARLLETVVLPDWAGRDGMRSGRARVGRGVFVASVRLDDESWLKFAASLEPVSPFLSLRFTLSMAVMLIAIVLLTILVVHHLTRPLRMFAAAARRLGTDVNAPPLPVNGPREVRQATVAFNEMQTRIRRFVEDRTQMLAAIAHDLRTPITRLRLRADYMEDTDQHRRMLADLDQMERMVASTLAFARDESGTEDPRQVDLATLIEQVCEEFSDAGAAVSCNCTRPSACLVRPESLRRALTNLVDNAVKYGNRARVRMTCDDLEAVIVVDDDGPGIPDDDLERVFRPFQRVDRARGADTGGTGLGLTVVRNIIRGHGGDVTLENRPEGGLRQVVRLPRS